MLSSEIAERARSPSDRDASSLSVLSFQLYQQRPLAQLLAPALPAIFNPAHHKGIGHGEAVA